MKTGAGLCGFVPAKWLISLRVGICGFVRVRGDKLLKSLRVCCGFVTGIYPLKGIYIYPTPFGVTGMGISFAREIC
jgi:hypothetical protein